MLRCGLLPNLVFGAAQLAETADQSDGKMQIAGINWKEILADILLWFPLRSLPVPATQARSLGA
jgi:hypothetical protein